MLIVRLPPYSLFCSSHRRLLDPGKISDFHCIVPLSSIYLFFIGFFVGFVTISIFLLLLSPSEGTSNLHFPSPVSFSDLPTTLFGSKGSGLFGIVLPCLFRNFVGFCSSAV